MCGRTACTLSPACIRSVANIKAAAAAGGAADAARAAGGSTPAAASGEDKAAGAAAGEEKSAAPAAAPLALASSWRRYNISPTGVLPIVTERAGGGTRERQVLLAVWGLRPPSALGAAPPAFPYSSFNARVEGLATSKLYKRLVNCRRCVLVVDGFYEWKKDPSDPKKKQPFFIRMRPAVRKTPIPLRQNATGESHHRSSKTGGSSHTNHGTEAEAHSHVKHPKKEPAAGPTPAAAAKEERKEQQEQQSMPPSSGAVKRRRQSADAKSEPESSSSNNSRSSVKKEEDDEETGGSGGSSSNSSAAAGDTAAKQAADVKFEKDENEEEAERGMGTLRRGEAPLLLAGLYDFLYTAPAAAAAEQSSSSSEDRSINGTDSNSGYIEGVTCSVTILTMSSTGTPLADLHTRIPVALSPETAAQWLDCGSNPFDTCIDKITASCKALYKEAIFFYAVTPRVGNSRYEAADCTEPLIAKGGAAARAAPAAGGGGGGGAAAAKSHKQQFLFFAPHAGGEAKRQKQEEAAGEQQRQQHDLRHQQQHHHVQKTEEKEEQQQQQSGSPAHRAKPTAGQAAGRGVHKTRMKSMHHFFKPAPPKKQTS